MKIEELFIKLVEIDSPVGKEKELASFVMGELEKLNFNPEQDKFGNIIARSKNFDPEKSILLCAHLDTTESTEGISPINKDGIIYSDGKTILGADNKAAIAEILYTLENNKNLENIELLFTVQEEDGLVGAKNLDKELIKSKKALVLDYSFPPGHIAIETPSAVIMKTTIFGKPVHGARVNSQHNAIGVSGTCIDSTTTDVIGKDISYNIGKINGGDVINTAPSKVILESEFRSFDYNKLRNFLDKNKEKLKKIAEERNCEISIEEAKVGSGYSYNPEDNFVKEIINSFKKIDVKTKLEKSAGLSDANVLNEYGIKAIEIGYGPQKTHTKEEFVKIKDMEIMSAFLTTLLQNQGWTRVDGGNRLAKSS